MDPPPDSLPLAWIDTDFKDLKSLSLPKKTLRKTKRRDKGSKQVSRLLYQRPTPNKPAPLLKLEIQAKMNPAFVFGLQVSNLILRDTAMLQAESQSEDESPDSTVSQRNKALQHAKLITEQLSQRSSKRRRVKRSGKSSEKDTEVFRFTDLPPEIRDMICTFYFASSSGEKPSLMWAFKINGVKIKGDFYDAAEKIYYTVNNWTFNIKDCLRNSIVGNMDKYHVEMLSKLTIEIPREVQPCTKLSSALQRAVNVEDLTLSVRSDTGVRRAIHEIIPGFKHLRRMILSIPRSGSAVRTCLRSRRDGTEYYKLFRPVRAMMDKALGQQGVLIQDTARLQEWLWEIDNSCGRQKVFKITCPKKHIKFE